MTYPSPHQSNLLLRITSAVLSIAVGIAWAGSCAPVNAQWLKNGIKELPSPLVDSEPFDLIILNDRADNAILKVKPLGDRLPEFPLEVGDTVVFELFADFDERLEVPHGSIKEIQTFNDLLLEESRKLVADEKYSKAFRALLYLYDNGSENDKKVVDTMRSCMFLDATQRFREKKYEQSLSTYEDIYLSDPNFPLKDFDEELIDVIMLCYDGIIKQRFDAGKFATVRNNVATVANQYPNEAEALIKRWNNCLLYTSPSPRDS